MADPRVFTVAATRALQAGIITKIRVENFMCHSHMEISMGDRVNFITGQNGSKSIFVFTGTEPVGTDLFGSVLLVPSTVMECIGRYGTKQNTE